MPGFLVVVGLLVLYGAGCSVYLRYDRACSSGLPFNFCNFSCVPFIMGLVHLLFRVHGYSTMAVSAVSFPFFQSRGEPFCTRCDLCKFYRPAFIVSPLGPSFAVQKAFACCCAFGHVVIRSWTWTFFFPVWHVGAYAWMPCCHVPGLSYFVFKVLNWHCWCPMECLRWLYDRACALSFSLAVSHKFFEAICIYANSFYVGAWAKVAVRPIAVLLITTFPL